ncbi:MAG: HAD-IIA family hydrolase [Rubrivivax sp.]
MTPVHDLHDPVGAVVQAAVQSDGWVLDVDGCLVRTARAGGMGGRPIDGAADLLRWLRRHGKPFIVCTNASQRTAAQYAAHLRELGLDVRDGELMTAATASAAHVARAHPGEPVLVLGDEGLADAMRAEGVTVVEGDSPRPGVVVVGAADRYTTAALNAACLAVADHGAAFYVTVDTPWFHGGLGKSVCVSSAIAHAIAGITGRQPVVSGKPSPALGAVLRDQLGGDTQRLVVVGDVASIEIRLAHLMGALGVLVLSGGTAAADVPALPAEHTPHLCVDDVGALFREMAALAP